MNRQELLQQKLNELFEKVDCWNTKDRAFVWVEYRAERSHCPIGSFKNVSKDKLMKHQYTLIEVDGNVGIRIDDYIDTQWPQVCRPLSLL